MYILTMAFNHMELDVVKESDRQTFFRKCNKYFSKISWDNFTGVGIKCTEGEKFPRRFFNSIEEKERGYYLRKENAFKD